LPHEFSSARTECFAGASLRSRRHAPGIGTPRGRCRGPPPGGDAGIESAGRPSIAVSAVAAVVASAARFGWPAGLAAAFALLLALSRRYNDVGPVKEFIMSKTDIEIVDAPIPKAPYVLQLDGELVGERKAKVSWYIKSDDALRRGLRDGALGFGEAYMEGQWDTDDIERFCSELLRLEGVEKELGWRAVPLLFSLVLGAASSRLIPRNTLKSAPVNVGFHYNISNRLYEKMLGPTMMYSSAYFCKPGMDLDAAQRAKMKMIAEKLDLRPGLRVLEIGFGWGSVAHFLASEYGVKVTGLSLSQEQLEFARERNAHPNVEFLLQDYRTLEAEPFDRIVSIEMIEHVGRKHLPEFFGKCDDLLVKDGVMLIQSIGCSIWKVMVGKSFIEKYIFPGCEPPQQTDFASITSRFHLEDWQSFGKDYARTMRLWRYNLGNWEGLEEFDERFRRMWEYYLLSCAASFDRRRTKVWQLVYTKTGSGRTRDCHHARGASSEAAFQDAVVVPA